LQYVRTLTCVLFCPIHALYHSDFFAFIHRLQRLVLRRIVCIEPDTSNFLVFRDTLSSLFLDRVCLTWGAFVTLIDYFPNLRDLHLSEPSFVVDRQPTSLSRPPRGKFGISVLPEGTIRVFSDGFSKLELEYDELEITWVFDQTPPRIQRVISACEKTLTRLTVGLDKGKLRYHTPYNEIMNIF